MNYQHSFHAGSLADVFKHWVLVLLLEKLNQKQTPFGVLDTHAGAGFYDLKGDNAQRTLEYEGGIGKLIKAENIPAAFQTYLQLVSSCQDGNFGLPDNYFGTARQTSAPFSKNKVLRYYPGSPYIIQQFLREHDRLIACELHAETYRWLKQNLDYEKRAALHEQDAYHGMKAFLPLKEKRGLILIDPPFEVDNEFKLIVEALKIALHRFQQGIYAIWYPIKHRPPVRAFHEQLQKLAPGKVLIAEVLQRDDDDAGKLNGNGMAIINPPWQLQETLAANMPWLATYFALDAGARAEVKLI
ncbi:MAG: 23S rRNA (adenine(2030)-N(6))-methyltransferase RlmJ [Gammaproteobacteria bacterium]